MNKLKALITTVILASSSAAMASPLTISASGSVRGSFSVGTSYTNYSTNYSGANIHDHRVPVRTPVRAAPPVRTPVFTTVTAPVRQWDYYREPVIMNRNLQFSTPGADGEMPFNDAAWQDLGMFGAGPAGTTASVFSREAVYALHIGATSGRPAFTSLLITYQDGSRQEVQVNAYVDATGITIPTKVAAIRQVQFNSPSNIRGSFEFSIAHGI